jgi:hypothetical protein
MRKPLGALAACLALGLFSASPSASADSAADKATAREVATEGIELYRAGKYADALDRLKRAQALYDAPVHLLYIARSEEKLGQLVEGSETYRTLDRYTLPAGAPEAWTAAVEDGRKELAALEPRLPKLRLTTDPKDAPETTVQIDGAPVSAAVIGIARAVNPGTHHVTIAAKGYAPAETDFETKEGETKDVALTLAKVAEAAPVVADTPKTSAGTERALVGFLAGLRLGVGIPTGTAWHQPATVVGGAQTRAARDVNMSDAFQPGGSLELHAGVRIGRYFTPVLYLEGESLTSGDRFIDPGKVTNTSAAAFGFGVLVGTPPGKMGGFGEFDLVLVDNYSLSIAPPQGPKELNAPPRCDLTAKGGALRFGGGGVFPVASWLQLTPFATATLGRFNKFTSNKTCATEILKGNDIQTGDQRVHTMIVLGVGGDVVFGPNR